jgi:alpha-mannosidase
MKNLQKVIMLLFLSLSSIAQKKIYIANDDHTDYMWTADEATYRASFKAMIDYYINQNNLTANNPSFYQNRFNLDGYFWAYVYEKDKTPAQFQTFINQVKAGKFSIPYNGLVSCYGGMPAEGVLRGMYYPGYLQRKYGINMTLAVSMENQTLPLGLSSLWAGSGVKYSWRGTCGCVSKIATSALSNRPKEIYWYKGLDNQKVMLKWYSLINGNNQQLGGYAEARDIQTAINQCDAKCNTPKYPYSIAGAFGKGWDDLETFSPDFPTLAQSNSNASRQVIVSNEEDFFDAFNTAYGDTLYQMPPVTFGNEWELYCASMAETSARVKRSLEKLRSAEAMATLAVRKKPDFGTSTVMKDAKESAYISLGLYWEHDWTADGGITRTARATFQDQTEAKITNYVSMLFDSAKVVLAQKIKNPTTKNRFTVFNPLGWTRNDFADFPYSGSATVRVIDLSTGLEVPSQIVVVNAINYLRILATDIPAVGYKNYEVQALAPTTFTPTATINATSRTYENDFYKITFTNNGVITSLLDKKDANREYVQVSGSAYVNDIGSGNSNTGGVFTLENNGSVSATILLTQASTGLKHKTRLTIFKAINRIDIQNEITENFGDTKTWKFSFNLGGTVKPTVWYEEVGAIIKARTQAQGGHYANYGASGNNIARYDWQTMNHFADMSQNSKGVIISNADCYFMKVGNSTFDLDSITAQISVLAGGQIDGTSLGIQNQNGVTNFKQRFAIRTYADGYNSTKSMKFSMEHQNPFVAIPLGTNITDGYPEKNFSLLKISDPNTLLWTLKPSEQGNDKGVSMRVWNVSNSTGNNTFSFTPDIQQSYRNTHVEVDNQALTPVNGDVTDAVLGNQMKTYRMVLANADCPDNRTLTNPISGINTQYANIFINAKNTVNANANVQYFAGKYIDFLPNFQTLQAPIFRAEIKGCGEN